MTLSALLSKSILHFLLGKHVKPLGEDEATVPATAAAKEKAMRELGGYVVKEGKINLNCTSSLHMQPRAPFVKTK